MTDPSDTSKETIKRLFDQQIRRITMESCGVIDHFDVQFSDAWL
jgi:hypothetical protein